MADNGWRLAPHKKLCLILRTCLGCMAVVIAARASGEPRPAITYAVTPPGDVHATAADTRGNVYVVGSATTGFQPTPGAAYPTRPDGRSSYLLKLDPTGDPVFATFLPGSASTMTTDPAGSAYIITVTGEANGRLEYGLVVVAPAGDRATLQAVPIGGHIALDLQGDLYIASTTIGLDLPVTADALQKKQNGPAFDGYLVKMNPRTGSILYATYLGGSGNDYVLALAVDAAGNAYVAGETNSTDFPVTPSAYLTAPPQKPTYGFVAKLSPTGSALVYSTYFDGASGIAVDPTGAAFIAHGYVSKLSPDGRSLVFTTAVVGGHSVAIDSAGNFVGIGSTTGTGFPLLNPLQAEIGNTSPPATCIYQNPRRLTNCADVTMAKFDPQGNVLWSSELGGSEDNLGGGVMVDGAGNIYAWMSGFTVFALPGMSGGRDGIIKIEPVGPPPLLKRTGVVSSAGFKPGIGRGGLVTLFGTGLTDVQGVVTASSFPLPTTLEGTSVRFAGEQAPLLAVANVNGQEQVNFQLPAGAPAFDFNRVPAFVIVKKGRALGFGFAAYFAVWASIFRDDGGRPAVTHADYSPVSAANPVHAGETILIYATGLGSVNPPVPDGEPAPAGPLSRTVITPEVRIGGQPAQVAFSGLAPGFVGVNQVNVIVPAVPPGEAQLEIGSGGVVHDSVRIPVQ